MNSILPECPPPLVFFFSVNRRLSQMSHRTACIALPSHVLHVRGLEIFLFSVGKIFLNSGRGEGWASGPASSPGVNTNTRLIVFQFSHLTEYPTISLSSSLSEWTVWTVSGHCTNNYLDCLDLQIYVETINIAIMLHGHVSSV